MLGGHSGCALMLLQKDANIDVDVHPEHHVDASSKADADKSSCRRRTKFKFLKSHFEADESLTSGQRSYPLFRGIVQNGWLGLTYVALDKMEKFGVSYARYQTLHC